MPSLRIKRGTRAQLTTAAGAAGLKQGELYHVTDEDRVDLGTGTSASTSLAKKSEVDAKQATLVSGTNIKTINGASVLGSGDLAVSGMTYPGAGIAVSTGSAWGTSKTAPAGALIGDTDAQTLTNKTLAGAILTNGYSEETNSANTGTAYTIAVADGLVQRLTLTGNCTLTFPSPATAGMQLKLLLIQDATGSRTVSWPASVKWPSGSAPTVSAAVGAGDRFDFISDGTRWWGFRAAAAFDFAPTTPVLVEVSSSLTTSNAGISVPALTSAQAGDLVLLVVSTSNQSVSTPAGWTLAVAPLGDGTAGSAPAAMIQVFYKLLAGADEATSVSDAGNHTSGMKIAYRGVDQGTPLDATPVASDSNNATATSLALTGITTVTGNALVVAVAGCGYDISGDSSAFYSFSAGGLASVTERFDHQSALYSGGGIGIADGVKNAAGASGSVTATGTNAGYWSGVVLALRPAA